MNENMFEKMEEEQQKERRKSWLRGGFLIALLAVFGVVVVLMVRSSMTPEELKNSLTVASTRTSWIDKEVTPFEVSIVPAVWITLKNSGTESIQYLQLSGRFEFTENGKVHSSGSAAVFKKPLEPGETSQEILIRANYGYKATSREAFLENRSQWKPMQVKIFARAKGSTFVQIGDLYPVEQKIIGAGTEGTISEDKQVKKRRERTAALGKGVRVAGEETVWVEKSATPERVVIVPRIRFSVENVGEQSLDTLIFKGVFLLKEEGALLGEGFNTDFRGRLEPGETSDRFSVKSDLGFSASSKKAFFENPLSWKAVKVRLFVKTMNTDFALLGIYPVSRKIQGVRVNHRQEEE